MIRKSVFSFRLKNHKLLRHSSAYDDPISEYSYPRLPKNTMYMRDSC